MGARAEDQGGGGRGGTACASPVRRVKVGAAGAHLLGVLRALAPAHTGHDDGEERRDHRAPAAERRDRVDLPLVRDERHVEVLLALHRVRADGLVQLQVEQARHVREVLVHPLVREGEDLAPDLLEAQQLLHVDALHNVQPHDPGVVVHLQPAVVGHLLQHPERLPRRLRHAELQQPGAYLRVWRALPAR